MAALMLPGLLNGAGGSAVPGSSSPGLQEPTASQSRSETQPDVSGRPDAAVDRDLQAVEDERKQVLDQLGNVRGRIKSGTGQILDSVPGSR